ncbi:MAG: PQQ-binding-like beta-propeller repeat protein [Planctomycetes bacterium]|nr:PQQ-binding-like beta-propeller repeat protein [Planctomycetota bacterium]
MKRIVPVALVLLLVSTVFADNWPAWRGADGTGISRERNLPTRWSPTENIRWKVPLPEPCNSTPVIWDNHVFLTQGLDGGRRRALLALDRETGKTLWQREVPCATKETTHRQNPPCSSSPVTDGKTVYTYFASSGVLAFDFKGNELWKRDFGPVLHRWGNGGSPILYKNLLILFHGPGDPSILYALDKNTGETIWKSQEVGINSNIFGSWSTPLVLRTSNRDELILPLPGEKIGGVGWFKSYDPNNGKLLWQCDGLGNEVYAMPIVGNDGGIIVGISGHNGPTMAVRPGGSGNVTESHRLWRTEEKTPQRIGSGVIHKGHLFIADANGIMECLDAKTGEVVWKERVGGNLWGSILLAGGNLYATNLEGDTFIVSASPKYELVAKNSLDEPTYAALAVSKTFSAGRIPPMTSPLSLGM